MKPERNDDMPIKIKTKLLCSFDSIGIEKEINDFLETIPENCFVDIKFSTFTPGHIVYRNVMIIYKVIE